jgi:hypothetical protein
MHNVLGFDLVPPSDFRAKVRDDFVSYCDATTFASAEIKATENTAQSVFKATDTSSTDWYGRKVVLETGVTDSTPPEIEGDDDY